MPKKIVLAEMIVAARKFEFCGPSDDSDEQTAVITGYRHLVVQIQRLATPLLSEADASRLNAIDVDVHSIYSAYDARAELEALLPDIETALQRADERAPDYWRSKAEALQNVLVARATGTQQSDDLYRELRELLMSNASLRLLIPRCVVDSRNLGQFWQHIKGRFATYAERREHLWTEFRPLLDHLESGRSAADQSVDDALRAFDPEHVHAAWSKALERKRVDPEGAITAARTLLESICKHILDDENIAYDVGLELPKLYKLTARALRLAPDQHSEEIFKQILGGCVTVVEGLGSLRNKLSDAHGRGRLPVRPVARHAELAVNLAGALALFLVSTARARHPEPA